MHKTCDSKKRFGKEGNGAAWRGNAHRDAMFEALVSQHGDRAFAFARSLAGNEEAAKEVVQEAYYRVLREWDQYDPGRPLKTWFFAILCNVYRDARKRFDRRNCVSLDWPAGGHERNPLGTLIPDEAPGVLEQMERQEAATSVKNMLRRLPDEHSAILGLLDMQGLTYEAAARLLGVPEGTVRSRISRARESFRKRFPQHQSLAYSSNQGGK